MQSTSSSTTSMKCACACVFTYTQKNAYSTAPAPGVPLLRHSLNVALRERGGINERYRLHSLVSHNGGRGEREREAEREVLVQRHRLPSLIPSSSYQPSKWAPPSPPPSHVLLLECRKSLLQFISLLLFFLLLSTA